MYGELPKKVQQPFEGKPLVWAYECVIRALCVILVASVVTTRFAFTSLRGAFPGPSTLSGTVEARDGDKGLDNK